QIQTSGGGSKQSFGAGNPDVVPRGFIDPQCAVIRTPRLKLLNHPPSATRDPLGRADPGNTSTIFEPMEYIVRLYPKFGVEFRVGHSLRTVPHHEALWSREQ